MVICNPPFEDFVEESDSTQTYTSVHKPVEVLSQLLNRVPPYLGIVMPSGFNSLCSSLPGIKNGANGNRLALWESFPISMRRLNKSF